MEYCFRWLRNALTKQYQSVHLEWSSRKLVEQFSKASSLPPQTSVVTGFPFYAGLSSEIGAKTIFFFFVKCMYLDQCFSPQSENMQINIVMVLFDSSLGMVLDASFMLIQLFCTTVIILSFMLLPSSSQSLFKKPKHSVYKKLTVYKLSFFFLLFFWYVYKSSLGWLKLTVRHLLLIVLQDISPQTLNYKWLVVL